MLIIKQVALAFLFVGLIWAAAVVPGNYLTGYYGAGGSYILTVSTTGQGYVSSSPSGIECGYACRESYDAGREITLTAKPKGGTFAGWGGACSGTELTCTVVLESDTQVSAAFSGLAPSEQPKREQPPEPASQVQRSSEQQGVSQPLSMVQETRTVRTAARPTPTNDRTTRIPSEIIAKYDLTVKKEGSGVITSIGSYKIYCGDYCSAQYTQGEKVKLIAHSMNGFTFSGWSGACSGTSTCEVRINAPTTVTAQFASTTPIQTQPQHSSVPSLTKPIVSPPQAPVSRSAQRSALSIRTQSNEGGYPAACEDYPTMPGCPGEGTNIAPPQQPSIPEVTFTGFEPKKAYPMTVVYLKGKNLGYVSRVYFGGELVEGFSTTPDGSELQTIVPQNAKTGQISLVLTSGGAEYSDQDFIVWTGVCSNSDVTKAFKQLNKLPQGQKDEDQCDAKKYKPYSNYKELRNAIQRIVGFSKLPPPMISGFKPSPADPGAEISIFGQSFDIKADDIKFDGKSLPFRLIDDREIKITIPQEAHFGEHDVTMVSDIHGIGSAKIKIIPLPSINNFNPKKVWFNEEITITGENFYEPQEISFYEITTKKEIITKNFRAESSQQIKVNAPQTSGSYSITVKGKNSYVKTQTVLIVETKPLPPEITSIEPEEGKLGNSAIIYGKNLNSVTSITLNGYNINYLKDNSDTQKTIYVSWGIDQGLVEVKNPSGTAKAELISNKNPVTKLITGKEETCFGGVGKGCYGSEDGKEEWGWGSQKIVAPVGCSSEVNGQRNCWVVPGSIKHDNCCARYPSGKMCGGPGKDGQPAGENNHDGHCVDEWHAAFWDVFWWRAFVATFDVRKPTDLTPKPSSRYTLKDAEGNAIPSETAETVRLCASAGHELREQSDQGFCCSGRAENKKCTGSGRGVQALPENYDEIYSIKRTEKGADLSTVPAPLAPGETPKPIPPKPAPVMPPSKEEPKPVPTPAPPAQEKPIPPQLSPKKYTVTITKTGSGVVNSVPVGISCGLDCSEQYPVSTSLELTATPGEKGVIFEKWTGACSGTQPRCQFTITGDTKITASFKKVGTVGRPGRPTRPWRGGPVVRG